MPIRVAGVPMSGACLRDINEIEGELEGAGVDPHLTLPLKTE